MSRMKQLLAGSALAVCTCSGKESIDSKQHRSDLTEQDYMQLTALLKRLQIHGTPKENEEIQEHINKINKMLNFGIIPKVCPAYSLLKSLGY